MIKDDAKKIISYVLERADVQSSVTNCLSGINFNKGKIVLVAIGKAAWSMSYSCYKVLKDKIHSGIVITKYDHSKGEIGNLEIYEAGHPISDDNTYKATSRSIEIVKGLTKDDTVLFLVSGGGSALFENPLVDKKEWTDINSQLLSSGASITEINTIRKRLSSVKGGKFALLCKDTNIVSIVLSDIVGDPLDMIASGPCFKDSSTKEDAESIVKKYSLKLSEKASELIKTETPKQIDNVKHFIIGSVRELCKSAKECCSSLGYDSVVLTTSLECEARDAGLFISSIAKEYQNTDKNLAFIFGGETVVHLKGKGMGGRNQELVFSAIKNLSTCKNTLLLSVGSDGTDGPTDAAGAIADENTYSDLVKSGVNWQETLENNDSYTAFKKINSLVITGPTGTNVNDFGVLLIKRK